MARRHKTLLASGLVAWLIFVAGGARYLGAEATTPGARGATPASWPAASTLPRRPGVPTVVMFLHPRCRCSRASLAELNILMQHTNARAVAVFFEPDQAEPDWRATTTWALAGTIPQTTRVVDRGGSEAARFGAKTSGHVVVYDATGALRFAGGITDSRAHEGDNMGMRAVAVALAGGRGERDHAVFGCAIDKPPDP